MLATVDAKWMGSGKIINTFGFDFAQVGAPFKLQSKVAALIGIDKDAACNVRVCCGRTGCELTHSLPRFNAQYPDFIDKKVQAAKAASRQKAWSSLKQAIASSDCNYVVVALVTLARKQDALIAQLLTRFDVRRTYMSMPVEDRLDSDVALAAVQLCPQIFGTLALQLRRDFGFVAKALQRVPNLRLERSDVEAFQHDRSYMTHLCSLQGTLLKHATPLQRADLGVVQAALTQTVEAFWFMNKELRNNRELFAAAVYSHRCNKAETSITKEFVCKLLGVNESENLLLQDDKHTMLAAVQICGAALLWASDLLRDDRTVVLAAVKNDGSMLEHVSSYLRNDFEVVLAAVQSCGRALQWASSNLKSDRRIVLAAVLNDGSALQYANCDDGFNEDFEIVLAAVQTSGIALCLASARFGLDRNIVLEAVKHPDFSSSAASQVFCRDFDVALAEVRQHGKLLFMHCMSSMKDDLFNQLVEAAVQNDGTALQYAPSTLKKDVEVATVACRQTLKALQHVDQTILAQVLERVL